MPRLDEAGLDQATRAFKSQIKERLVNLEQDIEDFIDADENSMEQAQLGYRLFRVGMEMKQACTDWLLTVKADQQQAPDAAFVIHTRLGMEAIDRGDWREAIDELGVACRRAPRCHDAIRNLALCAEKMAAAHLHAVAHLPDPDKFSRGLRRLGEQVDSLEQQKHNAPADPSILRTQTNVLNDLIQRCDGWAEQLGKFTQQERRFSPRQSLSSAWASVFSRDPRSALRAQRENLARNPASIGALQAVRRLAQELMARNTHKVREIEENIEMKEWLRHYKAEMQSRYDMIDRLVGRSPQGDPFPRFENPDRRG